LQGGITDVETESPQRGDRRGVVCAVRRYACAKLFVQQLGRRQVVVLARRFRLHWFELQHPVYRCVVFQRQRRVGWQRDLRLERWAVEQLELLVSELLVRRYE